MKSPVYGVGVAIGSTSAVRYSTLGSANSMVADDVQQVPMPCPGTFSQLRPWMTTAPGSGKSYEYMLMKNGATTDLASTVADTAQYNDNTANTATVVAGDLMSMRYTPSGTPASSGYQSHTLLFESSDGRYPILGGTNGSNLTNSATRYISLHSAANAGAASTTYGQTQAPHACTIDRLYISLGAAPGADTSYTFTLQKNGSATDVTVTISDTATTGNDTAHTIDVAEGDLLVMVVTPTGTPTATTAQWGIGVTPDTDGESWQNYRNTINIAASTTYIAPVEGAALSLDSSERYTVRTPACTVKRLFPRMRVAPGSGNSIAFTFQKNTSDQTLTATIADTATVASDTAHTFDAAAGDSLQVKQVVSASIAQVASYPSHSWVAYIASSAEATAAYSPLGLTLTVPSITASYVLESLASFSPLALALSVPAITATSGLISTAAFDPVTLSLVVPSITATSLAEYVAAFSTININLSVPAITATFESVNEASFDPVNITVTIPEMTASSATGAVAVFDPITLNLSVPEITATSLAEHTASFTPIPITLTIPDITASHIMEVEAVFDPINLTLTIPDFTVSLGVTKFGYNSDLNCISFYVDGIETARLKSNGDLDIKGTVNESAF